MTPNSLPPGGPIDLVTASFIRDLLKRAVADAVRAGEAADAARPGALQDGRPRS